MSCSLSMYLKLNVLSMCLYIRLWIVDWTLFFNRVSSKELPSKKKIFDVFKGRPLGV
jgi:hypothetical protein